MTSTHIRTCLIVALFVVAGAAAGQPDSVPAEMIKPRPVQAQPQVSAEPEASMPALRVGMPAPALKVAKWFKGAPVEKFEPGKIYVVEFWATWCGPCKTSIPHLTELARKHAEKVTIIGVSAWERPEENTNEAIFALVESFVKDMAEKMDYHVAADGIDQTMANTWMSAAERTGIPCAFIVGRDGKVAWIGHPMTMDDVLAQVVAGTFDVQAAAKQAEIEWRQKQEQIKLVAPIRAALQAQDNKAVVEAVDKAVAAQPQLEPELMSVKLRALMQVDEPRAFAYLKTLLENGSVERNPFYAFNAALILSQQAATLKAPDYALVIAALEKAKAAEQENPTVLLLYAEVLFKAGRFDQAVAMQQKAIEKGTPFVGTRLPPTWLDTQKAKLEEYKAKKN